MRPAGIDRRNRRYQGLYFGICEGPDRLSIPEVHESLGKSEKTGDALWGCSRTGRSLGAADRDPDRGHLCLVLGAIADTGFVTS